MAQTEAILNHLKQGKSITPLEALDLYGCSRLSARIDELKSQYPIKKEMVTNGKKWFARYSLEKKVNEDLFGYHGSNAL